MYPRTCPVCGKVLGIDKGYICKDCQKQLVYITEPKCMKCGKKLLSDVEEYCYDCKKQQHYFINGLAPFAHVGAITDSIYKIKYNNKREYIDFFVNELIRLYQREILSWGCDALVPVPIHRKKKIIRGYNQAECIAKRMAKHLNLPVCKNGLIRVKNTVAQKELNDKERRNNIENAFIIGKDIVKYSKIILVDDIYTTGSTIDACSKTLLNAGVQEVHFVCLSIGNGF